MKNEVNRALAAKKRIYFQPEIQVASIALRSVILTGSPEQENMGISNTPTTSVW